MGWICKRCIKIEHDAGKSMVTVPEEVLGNCSYCGVENWVFEVVGDVPAKTIAEMPELKVEKPKKRKKREVSESIPPLEEASQEKDVITSPSSEGEEESIPEEELSEVLSVGVEEVPESSPVIYPAEPVEKSLEDMTEDELRARLAELEK